MKDNLTEIVFILDRSGSMGGVESDTIGGYNSFIEKQKLESGEAYLTTVLFDDIVEFLHDHENISEVKPITNKDYFVRGTTALLDAVGKTIGYIGSRLSHTPEDQRPSKVIFVITTDGLENASREFTAGNVKRMVQYQTEKYNWKFLFLGANIDSFATGKDYGINPNLTSNYRADPFGTRALYNTVNEAVKSYRASGEIKDDWSEDLKEE